MASENASPEDFRRFYDGDYVRSTDIAAVPEDDDFMYGNVLKQLRSYTKSDTRALDLGCNNGSLSLYMAKLGCSVLGIDLSQKAIELAKLSAKHHRIDSATFACMDFAAEWDKPSAFDFVLCSHVIEHVPADDLFLQKIHFALRPSGRLLLLAPSTYSSFASVNRFLHGRVPSDDAFGHLRRYTVQSLRVLVQRSGLVTQQVVLLDGFLREWFILARPLRVLNKLWARRFIRTIFNTLDLRLARFTFPATICIHAVKLGTDGKMQR